LWLLHRLVLAVAYRRVTDPWSRYRWRKTITYFTIATGVLIVGRMWFAGLQAFATFLGLLTAGLAIALRDPISDLAAWLFIVSRRPFEVGDRIQIGDHSGDVIDVRLFHFTLNEIGGWVQADQASGRIIHVPNGRIFSTPIANYDKGFKYIWNEVPVLVTFDSNWKKAKEILTRITLRHAEHLTAQAERELLAASQRYLISYKKLTPIVYTRVLPQGIQLTIRYLIEPRKRRGTEHAIWEEVLTEFAKASDVQLAYMTTREEKTAALRAAAQSRPPQPEPQDLPDALKDVGD
jgi:small-conductance mechanosensitive channel